LVIYEKVGGYQNKIKEVLSSRVMLIVSIPVNDSHSIWDLFGHSSAQRITVAIVVGDVLTINLPIYLQFAQYFHEL
jgi:hypothetical protein